MFDGSLSVSSFDRKQITYKLTPANGRYFVYILIDRKTPIYVGRTKRICSRLYQHKFSKQFEKVIAVEYPTYEAMCKAENDIIRELMPKENINGVIRGYQSLWYQEFYN